MAGLLALAVALTAIHLYVPVLQAISARGIEDPIQRLVLLHSTLPRHVIALLCGAGLSVSGAILQQVLRNPLASPDTVAVSAGARLALAVSTLLAPGLLGFGRDVVAIAGAAASTTVVLLIARRRKYAPLALILGGLITSLFCGALSTILVLLNDRYLVSLFIWGSGSLSQQSWDPAIDLAIRLGLCVLPLLVLLRPLSVLDAGEQTARSLGIAVERLRVFAIALAVLMSAFVTSTVGMIGFVGLAGPVLTRLCGRQKFPAWCLSSGVVGALLLLITDLLVQLIGGESATFLPTGAVTAVIGAPLLLLLLPHMKAMMPPQLLGSLARRATAGRQLRTSTGILAGLALLCLFSLLVFVGRAPNGAWAILDPEMIAPILPWRLPRMLGAAGAGALLATAGYILQRITGNPMASPEIMGVSAGAILGAATMLVVAGSASSLGLTVSAAIGSFAALVFVLSLSMRRSFALERMLLAGVALTALVDALVGVIMATGDPVSVTLLAWISGSVSGVGLPMALGAVAAALLLLTVTLVGTRWLQILPLGVPTATSIGVPVTVAQGSLLCLVALMTAIATPMIGPITFVGLMAPHIVVLFGIRHVPTGLILSGVVGASLMILADTLARTLAFPLQLPTGILASLLAGPFLLLLIASGGWNRANVVRKKA